jgi:membrane protease YdiL (CAAX protease family)
MRKGQPRTRTLVEVALVFLLAVVLFRCIRVSAFSEWELEILPGQGLFFLEYGAVLGMVLVLLAVTRRDWERYGITLQDGRRHLRVLAIGLLPVLALGGVLGMVNWTTLTGSLVVSGAAVGVLVVVAWALKDRESVGTVIPTLALVLVVPSALGVGAVGTAIIKTVYFYLLVGPAEEVLFRGYVQSRLNAVFEKPFRFFGVEWGWGLVMASALFGLWHVVLSPLGVGAWWHGVWTFFAGLIFGYVRERSGGVLAASILHSVLNYMPLLDLIGI